MLKIDILTLFPNMFSIPLNESIMKRAQEKGLVQINTHDLRQWTNDKHRTVDDRPYGGGPGMVLMIEPVDNALKDLRSETSKVILLSPQGKVFKQALAKTLSQESHLVLIAGHYEGFDERIREHLIDTEISIGDYVLTGGELPAMIIADAIVRLLPGVLKKEEATITESFTEKLLDFPQYTRPEHYNNWHVPEILLSGNHKEIDEWRKKQSEAKTQKIRPDLLKQK